MPEALSAGGCWFPWQQTQREPAGAPGRCGQALAGPPNAGVFEQAERSQQSNHPGWQKLTRSSWERFTTSLHSTRADVDSEEAESTRRIMTMLRVVFRAWASSHCSDMCKWKFSCTRGTADII